MDMRVTISLIAAMVGCAASDGSNGGDEEVDALAREVMEARAIGNEVACGECYEELPETNQAECDAITGLDEGCLLDAYRIEAAASRAHLECTLPAERDYATCLEQEVACGDASTWQACSTAFQSQTADCDELPASVRDAIETCGDPG